MKFQPTIESFISITRFVDTLFGCWPLPPDTKPSVILWNNIWWWFIIIHLGIETFFGGYTVILHRTEPLELIKYAAQYVCIISAGIKMVICKVDENRIQRLIAELQEFMKHVTAEEKDIIQFYMDKSFCVHAFLVTFGSFGVATYLIGPVLLPEPLPGSVEYPFSIEPFWIWAILYTSHAFIGLQVIGTVFLNFIFTILMWFTIARFEILCMEFRQATSTANINHCIKKHQELIDYAKEMCAATRAIAFHVLSLSIFGMTSAGFTLTCQVPLWDLLKHAVYNINATNQLFMFTWPADYLIDMNAKIGLSAYSSAWFGKPGMFQNILLITRRSQIPVVIEINGILPPFSQQLFKNAASATFSYLTMLRAVTAE